MTKIKHRQLHQLITEGFQNLWGHIWELEAWQKAHDASHYATHNDVPDLADLVLAWGIRVARLERAQGTEGPVAGDVLIAPFGELLWVSEKVRAVIARLSETIELRDFDISANERTIANLKAGNARIYHDKNVLYEAVKQHEVTIARLENELSEQAATIEQGDERIRELQGDIATQEACIGNRQQRVAELEGVVLRLQGEKDGLQQQKCEQAAIIRSLLEDKPEPESCGNCYCYGRGCIRDCDPKAPVICSKWVPAFPQEPAVALPEAADGDKGERTPDFFCAYCARQPQEHCGYQRPGFAVCKGYQSLKAAGDAVPPQVAQPLTGTANVAPAATRDARGRFVAGGEKPCE